MVKTASFKRLILRAVLRQVSPMVIRLVTKKVLESGRIVRKTKEAFFLLQLL